MVKTMIDNFYLSFELIAQIKLTFFSENIVKFSYTSTFD